MKRMERFRFPQFVTIYVILGVLFSASCTSSSTVPRSTKSGTTSQATGFTVYVVFDGPWAFVPDPAGSDKVIAIAPKAKSHSDAYIKAVRGLMLTTGIYELHMPTGVSPIENPGIAVTPKYSLPAQAITDALNNKMNRFAIYLPKPDGYRIAEESPSKVDEHFPLVATVPEVQYASSIALQYTTASLADFQLTGSSDLSTFDPFDIKIGAPKVIQVAMEPTEPDPDPACNVLSKQAFYDLTQLLGLTLFIDFENYQPECQQDDPQNPNHQHPTHKPFTVTVLEKIRFAVTSTPGSDERRKTLKELERVQSIFYGSHVGKVDLGEGIHALQDVAAYLQGFEVKDSPNTKFQEAIRNVNMLMKILHRPQNDCKAAQLELAISRK